jgi:hypothetical protein
MQENLTGFCYRSYPTWQIDDRKCVVDIVLGSYQWIKSGGGGGGMTVLQKTWYNIWWLFPGAYSTGRWLVVSMCRYVQLCSDNSRPTGCISRKSKSLKTSSGWTKVLKILEWVLGMPFSNIGWVDPVANEASLYRGIVHGKLSWVKPLRIPIPAVGDRTGWMGCSQFLKPRSIASTICWGVPIRVIMEMSCAWANVWWFLADSLVQERTCRKVSSSNLQQGQRGESP